MLQKRAIILAAAIALLLSSCGYRPEPGISEDAAARTASRPEQSTSLKPITPSEPGTVKEFLSNESNIRIPFTPEAIRAFLQAKNIPNGDIYLEDDLLIVNIVGLSPEFESIFQSTFGETGYRLQDVQYSTEQLEEAQQELMVSEIYSNVNLYGWGIDVKNNRLRITMPDSNESKKPLIEALVDPDMITYIMVPLGDPLIGTIVEIDNEQNRFLFQEDGEERPNYWFSLDEYSELIGSSGEQAEFSDLQLKQTVRIWSTGNVLLSLPALATIRRLEID